jgi:two-component system cell cycle response regulator DivK
MPPPTVMLVEDNEMSRELIEDLLLATGYNVVAFPTGQEAMAWLASNRPDLIVMDINLPDVDGLTLTRRIKAEPRLASLPILAVTAYAMKGDGERILAAGCDGYISKPIDVQQFPAHIARYLAPAGPHGIRPTPGSLA